MKNIIIIISLIILAVIVGGTYCYFSGKEYVVRLTEGQIREKLEERLPLSKSYLFIIRVTLSNPRVVLENGTSRVNAGLDVLFNITINDNPKPIGGTVDVSGGVRYVAEEGQFFLVNPVIESLKVQGVAEEYTNKVNKALTLALTEYYESHPIYTLSTVDAKQVAARMILKSVIVENEELVVTLGI